MLVDPRQERLESFLRALCSDEHRLMSLVEVVPMLERLPRSVPWNDDDLVRLFRVIADMAELPSARAGRFLRRRLRGRFNAWTRSQIDGYVGDLRLIHSLKREPMPTPDRVRFLKAVFVLLLDLSRAPRGARHDAGPGVLRVISSR